MTDPHDLMAIRRLWQAVLGEAVRDALRHAADESDCAWIGSRDCRAAAAKRGAVLRARRSRGVA